MLYAFVSDVHLDPQAPEITARFLTFLEQCQSIDHLYILGDLFEVWIGDDASNTPFHQDIILALKALRAQGKKIFFLAGNRDFLVGPGFLAQAGLQQLAEIKTISHGAQTALLLHGDLLCSQDKRYQCFRQWAQTPVVKWLFLKLPLRLRQKIAGLLRRKSHNYTRKAQAMIMDVDPNTVKKYLRRYQAPTMIHGHTHLPATHTVNMDGHVYQRLVLSAWHEQGSVILWPEHEKPTLHLFQDAKEIAHLL
jgi:UDP-2,3-diacylglucosamine hydrolase